MGTGWRRAFCKTIPKYKESKQNHTTNNPQQQQEEPQIHQDSTSKIKSGGKLRIFSSISNPSTPRFSSQSAATTPNLRCRTAVSEPHSADNTPRLQCRTSEKKSHSPRRKFASNPSSPRSPFSILKNTLRISKNGCGVCLQSAKTGRGMAIYTAECSHSFHFPCIAQYAQKQGSLICPVCNVTWKDVPLLSAHKSASDQDDVVEKTITTSTTTTTSSSSSISAVETNHDRSDPSDDGICDRAFNDDEPLVSPSSGIRFKPIPEAEDEFNEEAANGEVEEFKGFFVNSTPSTPTKKVNSNKFFHDRRTQRNVEFKILPEAAVISIGRSHETFAVALRVKAPLPPPSSDGGGGGNTATVLSPSNRAPIDLVTVLDIGGSMTTTKLHMLKRAMRLVISSLGSSDRLSIVTFSSDPQRLLPLSRMTPQGHRVARRIIDQLSTGEGKSVSSAMRIAAKVLEDRREKNPVGSIILLSDGKDEASQNQGQATSHVASSASTRYGHIEIPVHSYGFGGADALAQRVGGILSVVVQDLKVQLGFSSGSSPCEITAVYSCNGRPTSLAYDSIRFGDLYAEEERELLVELRVPTSAIGSHHVMSVRCSYKDPATGAVMYGRERALLVPRPHAVRSSDPRIERLRNVFVATRAVAETRRMVAYGEFGSAQRLLMSARALVAQSGSGSAEEYVRWLDAEINELRQYQVQLREHEAMVRLQQQQQQAESVDENGETSAWGAAERLAKVALIKQSLNTAGDLHGFENARF